MRHLTEEWVDKSEGVYYTALREVNVFKMPISIMRSKLYLD